MAGDARLPRRGRGLGDPLQPRGGPLAAVVVEVVTRLRRLERRRVAPRLGPPFGWARRIPSRSPWPTASSPTPRPGWSTPQSSGELAAAAELLSLSTTETELLPQLRRGIALWKVGQRSFLVQHRLSAAERRIVDTDRAMSGSGSGRSRVPEPGRGGLKVTDPAAPSPLALGAPLRRDRPPAAAGRRHAVGSGSGSAWGALGVSTRPAGTGGQALARASRVASTLGELPGSVRRTAVAAEPAQSLVVVGPTQSGKTSGLAVPAILGWRRARGRRERQERPAAGTPVFARSQRHPCGASTRPAAAARAVVIWSPLQRVLGVARCPPCRCHLCEAGRARAPPPTVSSGTPRRPRCWHRSSSPLRSTGATWPT